VSQTPPPKKVKAAPSVSFDPPLPGPNVPHTTEVIITGAISGNNPQCRVIGLVRDHFVIPTFEYDTTTGVFKIRIVAGLIWDDNLYVVTVWSDDSAASGSIFLDTRPVG
jgi:hypothetical protein